ncbi:cysteine--tRNA ligase, partial [Candidatus Saccharibacteria bacterium]|nr:cysteine--tRNA ligase [Candidatus Saccharibacteria bacterium]
KMLKGALAEGTTAWEVAQKYSRIAEDEAYSQLGLLRPDHMPRATKYIDQQIAFVQELEKKGFTYEIEDGVYFDTSKLTDYGKLAKLDIEGLQFGARVEDTGKKNPTDFALWKFSNPSENRDMEWDSPFGIDNQKGFPGWHLECSVMAREILGDQIDIHTGGIDHIPVHHTNEIAQTEAVTGKTFANYWIHNNHIKVDGTKMSKSLGNIYTLSDITEKGYDVQAFKLLILSKHYRTEGNFTWEILEAAQNALRHWRAAADLLWQLPEEKSDPNLAENIIEALSDDLDTPKSITVINAYINSFDEYVSSPAKTDLESIEQLLGIRLVGEDITVEQKQLISQRQEARDSKDWQKSDELRMQLAEQGIEVKDTPNGPIWSRS